MSDHDERFKNLILDYPREALELFGGEELHNLPAGTRFIPLRDEQMSTLLGKGFRKVDVVLEVDKPDGEVMSVVELIEHHSTARGFSALRLARYVTDVAEMLGTTRVAANVLLVEDGEIPSNLRIGLSNRPCLSLDYHVCRLSTLNALDYFDSPNIAARIVLPNMRHPRDRRVDVCLNAVEGLGQLEHDPHKQEKYGEFIGAYGDLTPAEQVTFNTRVAEGPSGAAMYTGMWANAEKGGIAKGRAQSALMLLRRRGVAVSPADEANLLACTDLSVLDLWFDRAVSASSMNDVFRDDGARTKH